MARREPGLEDDGITISVLVVWQSMHRTIPACGWYRGLKWSWKTGVQLVVLWWHASQERAVTKCPAGLGVAQFPVWQLAQRPGPTPAWAYVTGFQAVVRWQASQDSVVRRCPPGVALALPPGRWQLAQLPGMTPMCEYGPTAGGGVAPPAARGVTPVVGGAGPLGGRTVIPEVGAAEVPGAPFAPGIFIDSIGLLAAAAAAAAKPPCALWQSMQSDAVVLPSWLPSVLVPRLTPNHDVPDGAWQALHLYGADDPEPGVRFPLV
jgi:hypothetical protein